ncbi:PucR family transcriptional regulator [Anaerobacillus sp. MEB173]|uniref:PucR family transcriptional regulator n=1 Tax=Anaerobacillus sp. MEB173 TaxID=3383345 RepID=UPI003F93ACFA
MLITVEDVCRLPVLQEANVKTSHRFLDQKQIEWVSVIETPVEDFVRKNEFVLTTGIGCGHDQDLFIKFVKEVIDSGAACMAIATGRYIKHTPKKVVQLAEQHQFPILEIPWEIRFADVIQEIMTLLNQKENKVYLQSEYIRKKLLNMILQGAVISDIANFMYDMIHLPVLITDKRGIIRGHSKKTEHLKETEKHHVTVKVLPNKTETFSHSNLQLVTIANTTALQLPIQTTSEIQGYLYIFLIHNQTTDILDHSLLHLLEHAVTTIALCFLQENTIRETEMRLRDDFVWSLAKGSITSPDTILSRAKTLGYNVSLPYLCIIGFPENLKEVFHKTKEKEPSYEHWLQNIIWSIEREIYFAEKKVSLKTMATFQRGEIIIFIEYPTENKKELLDHFIQVVEKGVKDIVPDLILSWGISKQAGIQLFHESFSEAHLALTIGRRQKGAGNKSTYSETRVDRALMTLLENQELQTITHSTIGALIDYTQERGIDLIHTFIVYNRNRGNVSQTARELNLHRQSLLYRLRKIETLTGCSLDNHEDNFLIELTIKLWTLGILEQK